MVLKAIVNRRSIREYGPDPVEESKLEELIKAAQYAPTANNNRSLDFVIVKDQEMKERIYGLCTMKQEFVREAPILIVPTIDPGKSVTPVQDLSIASDNIFLQAAEMGLGTVWKNLPPKLAQEVKAVLEIPESLMVINLIPVGYPLNKPQPHTEIEFKKVRIHYERW